MTDTPFASILVRHRMLVLVALGAVVYVAFLGQRDLWYPDEPDIGEVCRAMYLSGDWIVPRRNGQAWVDYWPFLYWAGSAVSWALGGMSEFSLRLPSALGAILLALTTCAAASRWFDPRTGLWAGVVLMTCFHFAYNAMSFRPDMLFSLMIGCGTLVYAAGARERPRWGPRAAGFALFGLAVLVKGPLGVLLPGLVLTLWHGSRREWRRILELAPLTLVALAVALPWAFACADAMGPETFWREIYEQNFMRYESGGRGHIRPLHYYATRIWMDVAPWSPLLPFAIWWIVRSELRRNRFVQLALWWFGASFVFLSLAETKRQMYLLPAYPAIALLLGPYLAALGRTDVVSDAPPDPRPAWGLAGGSGILLGVLGLGGVAGAAAFEVLLGRFDPDPLVVEVLRGMRIPAFVSGVAAIGSGVWIWRARGGAGLQAALGRLAVAAAVLYALLGALVLPALNPAKTYAPQCRWIREQIGGETEIGLLFPALAHHKMGAFGYYTGALVALLESEHDVGRFFARHPDSLVLVHEDSVDVLLSGTGEPWRERLVRELVAGRYRYFVFRGT